MVAKVPVGIIGCGNISPAYIKGCRMFDILDLVAVSDIDMSRARNRASEFNVPMACTVEELLANPDIKIVINLTIPKAHAEVNLAAIAAGKNVHCEKPLAVNRADGQKTVAAAKAIGYRWSGDRLAILTGPLYVQFDRKQSGFPAMVSLLARLLATVFRRSICAFIPAPVTSNILKTLIVIHP